MPAIRWRSRLIACHLRNDECEASTTLRTRPPLGARRERTLGVPRCAAPDVAPATGEPPRPRPPYGRQAWGCHLVSISPGATPRPGGSQAGWDSAAPRSHGLARHETRPSAGRGPSYSGRWTIPLVELIQPMQAHAPVDGDSVRREFGPALGMVPGPKPRPSRWRHAPEGYRLFFCVRSSAISVRNWRPEGERSNHSRKSGSKVAIWPSVQPL
jgi:hypothetical protein